jgi:hypothetical protein
MRSIDHRECTAVAASQWLDQGCCFVILKARHRLDRYRELRKTTSDDAARRVLDDLIREAKAKLDAQSGTTA